MVHVKRARFHVEVLLSEGQSLAAADTGPVHEVEKVPVVLSLNTIYEFIELLDRPCLHVGLFLVLLQFLEHTGIVRQVIDLIAEAVDCFYHADAVILH